MQDKTTIKEKIQEALLILSPILCLIFSFIVVSFFTNEKSFYQKGYEAGKKEVWVKAIDLPETHLCGNKGCDVSLPTNNEGK